MAKLYPRLKPAKKLEIYINDQFRLEIKIDKKNLGLRRKLNQWESDNEIFGNMVYGSQYKIITYFDIEHKDKVVKFLKENTK